MSKKLQRSPGMSCNGFDLLAPWYDLLLKLPPGKSIRQSQLFFIDKLLYSEKVLIIGEGTGNFLKEILLRKKAGTVWVVESSASMVLAAEKKISQLPGSDKSNVSFIINSFQEFQTIEKFDLIVTNYFLDLFNEDTVRSMGFKIRELLQPHGIWYFTDFNNVQNSDDLHWVKKMYLKFLYWFFNKTTGIEGARLPEFSRVFKELNMQEIDSKLFGKKLIKTILMKPKPI